MSVGELLQEPAIELTRIDADHAFDGRRNAGDLMGMVWVGIFPDVNLGDELETLAVLQLQKRLAHLRLGPDQH